jgi:hypothetical protein
MIPASLLRRIPGCAQGEAPLSVQLLLGGRSVNRNLRIDTRVGRFVLRQRIWDGPRPGADSLREVACHCAAAAAGVAPAVLDAAPDGRWILMDYIEGGMWTATQLQAAGGLRTLGARLRRLHAISPPRGLAAFDPVSVATGQAQAILEREPTAAAQVDALVARTRQLAVDCAAFAATPGNMRNSPTRSTTWPASPSTIRACGCAAGSCLARRASPTPTAPCDCGCTQSCSTA